MLRQRTCSERSHIHPWIFPLINCASLGSQTDIPNGTVTPCPHLSHFRKHILNLNFVCSVLPMMCCLVSLFSHSSFMACKQDPQKLQIHRRPRPLPVASHWPATHSCTAESWALTPGLGSDALDGVVPTRPRGLSQPRLFSLTLRQLHSQSGGL